MASAIRAELAFCRRLRLLSLGSRWLAPGSIRCPSPTITLSRLGRPQIHATSGGQQVVVGIPSSRAASRRHFWKSTPGPGPQVPRCGITQREFQVSTNCGEAMAYLGANMPPDIQEGYFYPDTGAALSESSSPGGSSCRVREPRRYRPDCPPGFTCTAGGECVVAGSRPPTAIISLEPPDPEP